LIAAALLLGFIGALTWLLIKDLKVTNALLQQNRQQQGSIRIVDFESLPTESKLNGSQYPLLPVTSIGRSPANTIVVLDDFASNEHALISLRGQHWWLEDLNSHNGTLLNDLPLEAAAVVTAGDVITIGQTRLKIEF
jgi:pSer/pThr/pTyr-binding forkhead associated (FHA) protein